jgi:hypothetical protein
MAALNFPNSPSLNDTHTENGVTFKWNGAAWDRLGDIGAQGAVGAQGATGSTGAQGATGPVAGSSSQVVYKDGSNNPAGSSSFTFDGTNLTVGGNVSIGGTLTYEDVTNIDSVGVVTARAGVKVPDSQKIFLGTGDDLQIYHDGSVNRIRSDVLTVIEKNDSEDMASFMPDGAVVLFHNGSQKFETTSSGIKVSGSFPDIIINDTDTTNDNFRILHNSGGTQLQVDPNNVSSGSYLLAAIDGSEKLRITSGGNLQVKGGNLHLDSNAELALFEDNTSGTYTNSAKIAFDFSGNVARMRSSTNGSATIRPLAFYTGNTERLRINADGNIGVGVANPTQKFMVKGIIASEATNSTNNWMAYTYTDNTFRLNYNGAGDDEVVVTSGGNISVGSATGRDFSLLDGIVTNPANGSAGILINSSSSSHNAYLGFSYGSGSSTSHADQFSAYIGRVGDNTLILGTNNNIRARVTSGGDLGLGVSGGMNQAGTLYIQGGQGVRWTHTSDGTLYGDHYVSADGQHVFRSGSGLTERLRIKSDGVVQVANRLTSGNIHHTPYLLTASEEAVVQWQMSQVTYNSSEEAFQLSYGSSYLSKSFFFGYNIDGALGYTFEILGKHVKGYFYMKLYYSDGTDSGNWSISGWGPSSYSTNTITVPTNKKVRGFHINSSSSISGYELYIKEIKIRRISTETNAPNDINIPDPMQFLNVAGGRTGIRTKVHSNNGFRAGSSNGAGMFELASSAGNTNIDTGIGINASNGGGAMMVLASRNTSNGTSTGAGMYLLNFRYDGNHVPAVTFIGGNNICTFGKTAGNNLTVNCGSGNWSVAAFFGGYGIGNMMS